MSDHDWEYQEEELNQREIEDMRKHCPGCKYSRFDESVLEVVYAVDDFVKENDFRLHQKDIDWWIVRNDDGIC